MIQTTTLKRGREHDDSMDQCATPPKRSKSNEQELINRAISMKNYCAWLIERYKLKQETHRFAEMCKWFDGFDMTKFEEEEQKYDILESSLVSDSTIYDALVNVFQLEQFLPLQLEIIRAILSRRDVFVLMASGSGKSLLYQLPAVLSQHAITFVVSPLLSLINDQVVKLHQMGVAAQKLTGDNTDDVNMIIEQISKYKLIYVTPERMATERFQQLLKRLYLAGKIERFVIDEAHCVALWNDFRNDYQHVGGIIRDNFPSVPILAVTGTATPQTVDDVTKSLKMRNVSIFKSTLNRNLFYEVSCTKDKKETQTAMVAFISNRKALTGIVYCATKSDCDLVSKMLTKSRIPNVLYHADLDVTTKTRNHRLWAKGEIKVMVATIAFGLGVDNTSCRYVVHYAMPKSLEDYYQQSGRAGRDGRMAHCLLYYTPSDVKVNRDLLKDLPPNRYKSCSDGVNNMVAYCQSATCRRNFILRHFGEEITEPCNKRCDLCLKGIQCKDVDITEEARQILNIIKRSNERLTVNQVVSVWRGSKEKRILDFEHFVEYGKGKDYEKLDALALMHHLIHHRFIGYRSVKSSKSNFIVHFECATLLESAMDVLDGRQRVRMPRIITGRRESIVPKEEAPLTDDPEPEQEQEPEFAPTDIGLSIALGLGSPAHLPTQRNEQRTPTKRNQEKKQKKKKSKIIYSPPRKFKHTPQIIYSPPTSISTCSISSNSSTYETDSDIESLIVPDDEEIIEVEDFEEEQEEISICEHDDE